MILVVCASRKAQSPVPTIGKTISSDTAAATLPAGTLFIVVKPDGSTVLFIMGDLKKMPLGQLSAEGKVEESPKISDVLAAAGVKDYQSIHLEGSSSPAELTHAQVDEGAILDLLGLTISLVEGHTGK